MTDNADAILISVGVDVATAWPREHVELGTVFSNLLVNLHLELFELLLDLVVDMALVTEELVRVVFALLLRIIHVRTFMTNVIDGALKHALSCHILSKLRVTFIL